MIGAGPSGPAVPALGPPSPAIMGDGRAEWTTKAPISHAGWALLGHSNAGNAVGTAVCMGSSTKPFYCVAFFVTRPGFDRVRCRYTSLQPREEILSKAVT